MNRSPTLARRARMLAVVGAIWASGMPAQAAEFNAVQIDRSTLGFVFKQMGVTTEGRFRKFAAQLAFDPAKPQAAQASMDVDITSIDAGSPDANGEVLGKPWFDAKTFPNARFVASRFKPTGANNYEVTGTLSIKGRSVELTAPASLRQDGANAVFDGSFVLRRADFGIGSGAWADFDVVANEVQIKFHLVATANRKP